MEFKEFCDFDKFCNKVEKALSEYYGEDREVSLKSVTKNNGVTLRGVVIKSEKSNIAPTVYLENFYSKYESGETFSSVIEELIRLGESRNAPLDFDPDDFCNFEKARSYIVVKLINTELNKDLLQDIPNFSFYDMSVVFYYLISGFDGGNASILINNAHMKTWKIKKDELYTAALENSEKMLPAKLHKMDSLMRSIFLEDIRRKFLAGDMSGLEHVDTEEENWMEDLADEMIRITQGGSEALIYVLTNKDKYFGASCMVYKNMMKDCAEKIGGGFYILPSSVHELILVPDILGENESELKRMVREVNDTQVEDEEILGYSVYHYDPEHEEITVVCSDYDSVCAD